MQMLLLNTNFYNFMTGGKQKLYKNANFLCKLILGIKYVDPEMSSSNSDPKL